jgi:NAD-dependent dihydropyrimidine dehydrogenase PreA subunit
MPKLYVVVSQGQSANPAKRGLEEEIVTSLLFEKGIEVTVVPHLYDLQPNGTGMLALEGITGDMIVLSWLYPRAAHWILDRNGIKGHAGRTLLEVEADEDEDMDGDGEETDGDAAKEPEDNGIGARNVPNRRIFCLDLRTPGKAADYVKEIQRIAAESSVQTVGLMGFLGGSPKPEQVQRYLQPSAGNVDAVEPASQGVLLNIGNGESHLLSGLTPAARQEGENGTANGTAPSAIRIQEDLDRRWYPVIDFSRCTNCLECLDFCLFGVYGIDRAETILVEQPDNCRKGCPACSRVCPANAIIFPQHKSPAIAGSPEKSEGAFKIDLSKLFGAPESGDALGTAVRERDEQLLLAGREAVGMSVGIPKRQDNAAQGPKDDLDALIDKLDALDL